MRAILLLGELQSILSRRGIEVALYCIKESTDSTDYPAVVCNTWGILTLDETKAEIVGHTVEFETLDPDYSTPIASADELDLASEVEIDPADKPSVVTIIRAQVTKHEYTDPEHGPQVEYTCEYWKSFP